MRESKGLKKRYDDLHRDVNFRGEAIREKYEIIQQYDERNDKLNSMLQWSRPIKAKLQEPIPDTTDVSLVTKLIADHKVRWSFLMTYADQRNWRNLLFIA